MYKHPPDRFLITKLTTTQHNSETNPLWNEHFDLHVKDPSTVLTVNVWDEDAFNSPLIGRWVMTTRFLVSNPWNCNYCDEDFKVTKNFKGGRPGTRIEGWFPLVDEDYKNKGKVGDIYLVVEWYHDEEFDRGYKPSPKVRTGPKGALRPHIRC